MFGCRVILFLALFPSLRALTTPTFYDYGVASTVTVSYISNLITECVTILSTRELASIRLSLIRPFSY
jgi:hypothetical protein